MSEGESDLDTSELSEIQEKNKKCRDSSQVTKKRLNQTTLRLNPMTTKFEKKAKMVTKRLKVISSRLTNFKTLKTRHF